MKRSLSISKAQSDEFTCKYELQLSLIKDSMVVESQDTVS